MVYAITRESTCGEIESLTRAFAALPPRHHLCAVDSGDDTRFRVDATYLKVGLDAGEQGLYVGPAASFEPLQRALAAMAIDAAEEQRRNRLVFLSSDVFFDGNALDIGRMLCGVSGGVDRARGCGYKGVRVAADAAAALLQHSEACAFLALEERVNELFPQHDISCLCHLDSDRFSPRVVADALRLHPYVLYQGTVCQNHCFAAVRQPLSTDGGMLEALLRLTLEREHFEQELNRRIAELEQANAELRQFVHVASHDLREPLRMIGCYVRLLAARYRGRLDADADEFISYAGEGAAQLSELIDSLVAYARSTRPTREAESVDCARVLADARRNLGLAILESGARLEEGPLPIVRGHRTELLQLFQNLVGNAIKFRGDAPPVLRVTAEKEGRLWTFRFRDNGIGIAPEDQGRVFDLFQRLHERGKYPGTGIGLSVCRKVVERHGGRIWVESRQGEGSTFCFTLPAEL